MRYRLILLTCTLIWGSSFVIVKDLTSVISPAWLIAIRFLSATAIMALITWNKRALWFDPGYLRSAVVLAIFYAGAWYTQTVGIQFTTPGKNAFLTATYCVIVPFAIWILFRQRPRPIIFLSAFLCLIGIGCISLNAALTINIGDVLTIVCAVFYALQIIYYDIYVQNRNPLVLTGMQFLGVALINTILALATEPIPDWSVCTLSDWLSLLYLILFCTTLAIVLQGIGQKHLSASTSALLLSLESVFGAAFSVALGSDILTRQIFAGFAIVFCAIILSEVGPVWLDQRAQRQTSLKDCT